MIVSTESVELYVDTLLRDPGPHLSVSAVANREVSRTFELAAKARHIHLRRSTLGAMNRPLHALKTTT